MTGDILIIVLTIRHIQGNENEYASGASAITKMEAGADPSRLIILSLLYSLFCY